MLKPQSKTVAKDAADHLAKFPALKPAAIDIEQASAYVSLSKSSIEKKVREGTFPRPRQLSGRRVAYLVRELDEWLESLPLADILPPVNCDYGRAGKPA